MGRHAHIARLALGRSPYTDPLRDENGDFVLGPHAHDFDNTERYRQQFNERGHPQNLNSEAAEKHLHRAQNEVLNLVGVVVKKGECRKTYWERLSDHKKHKLIERENSKGRYLKGADRIAAVVLPWSILSSRSRLLTFRNYCRPSLSQNMWSECQIFSPARFLTAGLPAYAGASLPLMLRYYTHDNAIDVEDIVDFINSRQGIELKTIDDQSMLIFRVLLSSFHGLLYLIEFPLQVLSILQGQYIVDISRGINWRFFLPFSDLSPFHLPSLPSIYTVDTIRSFFLYSLQGPFLISLIRDYLHVQIGFRLYSLFRQLITKPDLPDTYSTHVSDRQDSLDAMSIPGVGANSLSTYLTGSPRYFGPRSFMGAFRKAFPVVYRVLNFFSGGRIASSRGRLTKEQDDYLRHTARDNYRHTRRYFRQHPPTRGSVADVAYQRHIVHETFYSVRLSPDTELVDSAAWADATFANMDPSTPDQADTFDVREILRELGRTDFESPQTGNGDAENGGQQGSMSTDGGAPVIIQTTDIVTEDQPQTDVIELINSNTTADTLGTDTTVDTIDIAPSGPDAEVVTTETLLEALQNSPAPSSSTSSQPQTPVPGLSRAGSLTTPRPLRRPTETDQSLAAISENLRHEARQISRSHHQTLHSNTVLPLPRPMTPVKHSLYRVTMLSSFAADSLAWHLSSLVTHIILCPLEAMYLRSVASWFLTNPALGGMRDYSSMAALSRQIGVTTLEIVPVSTWFGGETQVGWRIVYVGKIVMTLGLEALIRGVIWEVGVRAALRYVEEFGWGKF